MFPNRCGLLGLLAAAALGPAQVHSQTSPPTPPPGPATQQRLAEIAGSFAERGLFNGTVLVARGDQVLLDQGWGLASQEWQVANAPGVKYLLASVSKQFTAAAVLRLVDQGRLGLDDLLSKHLDDLPAAWSAITVRQLMAHTSGLPNHTDAGGLEEVRYRKMSPFGLYAHFRDKPLDFAPGSSWNYSNSGYVMLGILIERLSGQSYADFLQAQLFKPLGMANSGVARSDVVLPQLASGYVKDGDTLRPANFLNMSVPYSAGALYGTTGDLLKWQRGLYGGAVLSPASLQAMTTPVRNQYALGLEVAAPGWPQAYGHSGGIAGFSTYLRYEPAQKLTIAVLSNQESAAAWGLVQKLSAAVAGQTVVLPKERKAVTLPLAALARLVGSYRKGAEPPLWVHLRGDTLWARLSNQPWTPLVAESASRFYAPQVDAELRFELTTQGPAAAASLPDLPGSPTWPRVALALPTLAAQPVFLRGSMNRWSTDQPMRLGADGMHRTTLDLTAGTHELKVASEDWSAIDLGAAQASALLPGRGSLVLAGAGRNIGLQLAQASRCEFSVDGRDVVEPVLSLSCVPKAP
jgi:CubicO group peptidase (beta-lactamase class C family)